MYVYKFQASDLAESSFNDMYYKQTVRRNEEERTSKFKMIYEVRGSKFSSCRELQNLVGWLWSAVF
jgi:hypothetical protein